MARFERSKGRNKSPRERFGRGRDSGRGSRSRDKGRREMTKATCDSCGLECELPFKPSSGKPVYCSNCFAKSGKDSPDRRSKYSERDLDIINEKLNKIMKALKIK